MKNETNKLGFIGVGRIANAVVTGFCTSNLENVEIGLSPRNNEISTDLTRTYPNVNRLESNQEVLDFADIVFISLSFNDTEKILNNLDFKSSHTIVSFVPYLGLSRIARAVSPASKICRAIPLPTVINHNCPIPIFNSSPEVTSLMDHIGKPFHINDENELHVLWTLSGFIAPIHSTLKELGDWAISKGAEVTVTNQYLIEMFYSLFFEHQKSGSENLEQFIQRSKTPNGMNEYSEKFIREKGGHQAYSEAADDLLKWFTK